MTRQDKAAQPVQDDTCYAAHARYAVPCQRESCRNWIDDEKSVNCVMIAARRGPMTLQEIGDIFGVTRMRICQIEKEVREKIHLPLL